MADAKKPDKGKAGGGKPSAKPAPSPEPSLEGKLVGIAFIALLVIGVVIPTVFKALGVSTASVFPSDTWERVTTAFESFVTTVSYFSIFISLLLFCGIVYANVMYGEAKKRHQEAMAPTKKASSEPATPEQFQTAGPDPRWRDIEGLMQSGNPADWRIAILEADIMLEDMLTQMGYPGNSIGDKLKQVDPKHFSSIQDAWSAHKVRNTIAHEGAAFQLRRSDADYTISQFKKVFDEFYFI